MEWLITFQGVKVFICNNRKTMILTKEIIEQGRSMNNGWSTKQMRARSMEDA
jgi:hypothetical protein